MKKIKLLHYVTPIYNINLYNCALNCRNMFEKSVASNNYLLLGIAKQTMIHKSKLKKARGGN